MNSFDSHFAEISKARIVEAEKEFQQQKTKDDHDDDDDE